MKTLAFGLLLLNACGEDWCFEGQRTQGGACVMGFDAGREIVETVERVVAPKGLAEFSEEHHMTYEFVSELPGYRGLTHWEDLGSERPRLVSTVLKIDSCYANTALAHEALHVMEIALTGHSINHSYENFFVRLDRSLFDNQQTLEYQIALAACTEQCPGQCQWEDIFGGLK